MTDDTQATDTNSDAEHTAPEAETTVAKTPAQATEKKKGGRGARSMKAATPTKATRARKAGKSEEAVAQAPAVAAEPVAKTARKGKVTSTARSAKQVKTVAPSQVAKPAVRSKRAKPEKTAAAAKPAKVAKSSKKIANAAPAAANGRDKGARYTTNELSSAIRKAGLTIEFTPVVTKPANIGRGPAREFKIDVIIAHLRGSNGDLIRDRGPGTPLYNDAESIAAVEIFQKFRGRTFHNKLKVEIL